MSAIFGRIEFTRQPVNRETFQTALSALAPYGVDGDATLFAENAGFGVQCLTLTASNRNTATHPVRRDTLAIVSDAILNNRDEIGQALGIATGDLPMISDNDLLLRAFRKWGRDMPRHVYGDYALAVFDVEKQSLFLTRDHIGTRPLFWSKRGDTVIFATDIRAILACGEFDWPVDENAMARFVMGPNRPLKQTFFKDIRSLAPGCHLTITPAGISETRWWDPNEIPASSPAGTEEHVAQFRALLEETGATYTATAGNIGAHISGGIDSCSVVAFGAMGLRRNGRRLTAGYSWAPPVNDAYPYVNKWDERHNIRRISETLDLPIRFGAATGATQRDYLELPAELDGIADLCDEVPVLRAAQGDGIRVMLSGWGGDEAFSAHGMGYLAHCLKRLHLSEARKVTKYYVASNRFRPRKAARALIKWGLAPMMPDALYLKLSPFVNLFEGGAFPSDQILGMTPDLAPYVGEDVRLVSDPKKYLANMMLMGHLNMRMETWAAWSSRHGFQYRYPLLDRKILEFVLAMPNHLFFEDGYSRYLARRVTQDILPPALTKHDRANEKLRDANHIACWALLKQEVGAGKFDGSSEWIDMPMLRATINRVPQTLSPDRLPDLARILSAVRIWHMEQRLRAR